MSKRLLYMLHYITVELVDVPVLEKKMVYINIHKDDIHIEILMREEDYQSFKDEIHSWLKDWSPENTYWLYAFYMEFAKYDQIHMMTWNHTN